MILFPTSLDLSLDNGLPLLSPSPLLISIDRYANKKKKNRNEVKGPSFRGIKYKKKKGTEGREIRNRRIGGRASIDDGRACFIKNYNKRGGPEREKREEPRNLVRG